MVASIRNSTDFPAPNDVVIQGNYAYVANQNNNSSGQGTFTVVDISNPLSPKVVGTANAVGLSGSYRVRVSGNTAYVAAVNSSAITTIDITVPAAPIVTAYTVNRTDLFEHERSGPDEPRGQSVRSRIVAQTLIGVELQLPAVPELRQHDADGNGHDHQRWRSRLLQRTPLCPP